MHFDRITAVAFDSFKRIFGTKVIYQGHYRMPGLFRWQTIQVDSGMGIPIQTEAPTVELSLSDLPGLPEQGESIDVASRSFVIAEVRPNDTGSVLLTLKERELEQAFFN